MTNVDIFYIQYISQHKNIIFITRLITSCNFTSSRNCVPVLWIFHWKRLPTEYRHDIIKTLQAWHFAAPISPKSIKLHSFPEFISIILGTKHKLHNHASLLADVPVRLHMMNLTWWQYTLHTLQHILAGGAKVSVELISMRIWKGQGYWVPLMLLLRAEILLLCAQL